MLEQSYYDEADKIIAAYGTEPRFLIPIIQDIQSGYKYLPPELLRYVADKLNIAEAKGKFILKVCDGTACHVRKSMDILNQLYKELGLSKEKHTTDDMMFTLETVSCLGACGLAPVMTVNDVVHPAMTPEKVTALIAELKEGADE